MGVPDETQAVTAARLANDHYAEVVRAQPARFSAFAALPTLLPRADAHVPWEAPDITELPTVAARRMFYDTVAHGHEPALRAAAESYGTERLMLGTDFPYQTGDGLRRAVRFIEETWCRRRRKRCWRRARSRCLQATAA
ncbi:hypothetical protein [Streptomyces sp. NPDC059909]|uniref:hypothetical protein n=1 Tax=Streptomyces sp. NPDC059909 TaxID=3346998 RepID=UPI0036692758